MKKNLRVAIGQLNFWVGDITGNAKRMIIAAETARDKFQADLIVFPELALSGYPPEDLLLRPDFHVEITKGLELLKQEIFGIDVIVGYPQHLEEETFNAASVIRDHKIITTYHKHCLPNYGVFDEKRYFNSGKKAITFKCKDITIGILICEDLWNKQPIAAAKETGAELIIDLNASPLDIKKPHMREKIMLKRAQESGLPIIYAHSVGGQDDLVFDGGSMAMNADGQLAAHAGFYEEKIFILDIENDAGIKIIPQQIPVPLSEEETIYKALVLSVRDYIEKNNFPGAIIGLSGGIDSALTLAIAADAIGNNRIHGVLMPSRYTSQLSIDLAEQQAQTLGVKTSIISIEPTYSSFLSTLATEFAGQPVNQTEENIQARCRGVILMALSNKTGNMVLTTGNKSEMAVGYATLYGDMAGGFAVLKDVPKTLVFRLAKYRNSLQPIIPQEVIDRPPSAELAPNQKDEDSLPPYPLLDAILELYVEKDKSPDEIVSQGFPSDVVKKVIRMVDRNEYKRRQSAPGPRITQRAFGRERRYPITSQYLSHLTR